MIPEGEVEVVVRKPNGEAEDCSRMNTPEGHNIIVFHGKRASRALGATGVSSLTTPLLTT